MSNWQRNQKQRDRQKRQRDGMLSRLQLLESTTWAPEDQELINTQIRCLRRDLDQNGIPGTYR